MRVMIDRNFKNFQSSMETTQNELLSSQLAKIEENIFSSYKFKRHGNEAQYRGNAKTRSGFKLGKNQHFHENTSTQPDRKAEKVFSSLRRGKSHQNRGFEPIRLESRHRISS